MLIRNAVVSAAFSAAALLFAQDLRLVRSLSGPSGKVDGSRFVFDETRSRFVHPQDKSFVVYFEWDVAPGTHALTALWKNPEGRVVSISPDVKIESRTRQLACYWTYQLADGQANGVWSVEVRVDGEPAGSHAFEIAGMTAPAAPAPPVPPSPRLPSIDEIYRSVSPALVSVHRFDATGRRTDTASGFVFAKDRILTAFQAVNAASKLEIEFAGGRRAAVTNVLALSSNYDWALLAASSGDAAPIQAGDPAAAAVGARMITFNIENGSAVIGGVDISGRKTFAHYGERIQFSPSLTARSAGGPLLDPNGRVIGVLGGSLAPGTRIEERVHIHPDLGLPYSVGAATPISAIPERIPEQAFTLAALAASGVIAAPLAEAAPFLHGGTTRNMSSRVDESMGREVAEFSRREKEIWCYSFWRKKGSVSKGAVSTNVYDAENRLVITVEPKKISLSSSPVRSAFSFSPQSLTPGIYRIDLLWDAQPIWRTFVKITE